VNVDFAGQMLRNRKDARWVGGGMVFLLAICGVVYYLLLRGKGLPAEMASDKLLLFVLWYINITLILSILFVLVRSLFRLLIERKNRILGSKFKTKLVITSIALSLIPAIILFNFASRLLLDSFDQWFTLPVDEVVSQAADTARALSDQIERTTQRDARRVLGEIAGFDLEDLEQRPALQHRVQELHEELQLHYLAIHDGVELVHSTADPLSGIQRVPSLRSTFLQEAIEKGEAIDVEDSLEVDGRLILAAVSRQRAVEPGDAPAGDLDVEEDANGLDLDAQYTVVVAGIVLPPDIAEKSENLLLAYQNYLQLRVRKEDLRAAYLLNLLMVTLLVVLAFSSIGLRLARRITEPIQALANAAHRISTGDLDHRIEVAVDDEIGVLVDAFNHMTDELRSNRELVDRKNRELLHNNKRIATVLQNVAAGVISISAAGNILTCNGAALEILRQRADDCIGRTIQDAWVDRERRKLVELLEEDFTIGGQLRCQLHMVLGGIWKTLEVKVTTLPGTEGQAIGGRVVVLEDLTELIHAQKMAAWNEVARRIAHEIKNPLTPIRLTAERLARKYQQGDPNFGEALKEGSEIIVREVSSLKGMVDEFSRYARMPRPQPREVDLFKMSGDIITLYQSLKPGVVVTSDIGAKANLVRFDPEQLKSVLINLLDNAIDATEAPGEVVLSSVSRNGAIRISVADTGKGVRPEDKEKLFLPYFSTKGRGTGLGLAIVERIVSEHNARIFITDNHPRGAVFSVEVPLQ
jgi:two-component system nitrogen regulation sensor histidine kinase NtrY